MSSRSRRALRAEEDDDIRARDVVETLVHHPEFREIVAQTSGRRSLERPRDSGESNTGRNDRREFTSVDAEMASIWRRRSTPTSRKVGKGKGKRKMESNKSGATFTKEVVLFPWPDCTGNKRAKLYTDQFIVSLLPLQTEMDEDDVMDEMTKAFSPILSAYPVTPKYDMGTLFLSKCATGCFRLQFLMPLGNRLVKPNLPPQQCMSGETLKKLYMQKTVYLLPDIALYV